jgi:hypothetical protein
MLAHEACGLQLAQTFFGAAPFALTAERDRHGGKRRNNSLDGKLFYATSRSRLFLLNKLAVLAGKAGWLAGLSSL